MESDGQREVVIVRERKEESWRWSDEGCVWAAPLTLHYWGTQSVTAASDASAGFDVNVNK